jgi:uncharacterized protein with HEPN domain
MPHDQTALLAIVTAGRLAVEFTQGVDRKAFDADLKTQSAVLHQLLILGEAVTRLSAQFQAAYPAVSWSLVAGLRDQPLHAGDEVNLDEVWTTVRRDLPKLLEDLRPLLQAQPR